MFPFGRSLTVGAIEVRRLQLEGSDADFAKAVLALAWQKLPAEVHEKLGLLEGELEIPWADESTSAPTLAEAAEELATKLARTIEAWVDEVLVGQEHRRQRKK